MLKRAFTLVELLVVISVISVLMMVLMPVIAKAREQCRTVICKTNLHQLFLANSGYATENNGYYVIAAEDIAAENLHRWCGVRKDSGSPYDSSKSPLVSYLFESEIKTCPSFKANCYYTESGQQGANFEAGSGGYGYNEQYVGGRYDLEPFEGYNMSARNTDVADTAATVMFADSAYYNNTAKGNKFTEYPLLHPPFWAWYLSMRDSIPADSGIRGRPDPPIHFRHGRFANVCWVDGHITSETMDFSAAYITHAVMPQEQTAAMALGWFGPDDNSLFDLQ